MANYTLEKITLTNSTNYSAQSASNSHIYLLDDAGKDLLFNNWNSVTIPHDLRSYNFFLITVDNESNPTSPILKLIPKAAALLGRRICIDSHCSRTISTDASIEVMFNFNTIPQSVSVSEESGDAKVYVYGIRI